MPNHLSKSLVQLTQKTRRLLRALVPLRIARLLLDYVGLWEWRLDYTGPSLAYNSGDMLHYGPANDSGVIHCDTDEIVYGCSMSVL